MRSAALCFLVLLGETQRRLQFGDGLLVQFHQLRIICGTVVRQHTRLLQ